jgi:hypothetical protein
MLDSIIYIVVRPYKLYYTAALFLAYEVERYIDLWTARIL